MGVSTLETDDVELVDAVTLGASTDAGETLVTWLVNGSLRESVTVDLEYGESIDADSAEVTRFAGADGDPFATHGWDADGFECEEFTATLPDGSTTVDLPPAGVAVVELTAEEA